MEHKKGLIPTMAKTISSLSWSIARERGGKRCTVDGKHAMVMIIMILKAVTVETDSSYNTAMKVKRRKSIGCKMS